MSDFSTEWLRELLLRILPDGDFSAFYEVHSLTQKFFFRLQIFYSFFFGGLLFMYILIAGIDYSIHNGFVITISMLASTLFATEAYRSWKVSSLFANREVVNSVSEQ